MRLVVQRVREASVTVNGTVTGAINQGLMVLVGIHEDDTSEDLEWLCNKVINLRVFDDDIGKMNLSVSDIEGELLVISQFTLYGDVTSGHRPSYTEAANPDKAEQLYERFVSCLNNRSECNVETGEFGAYMEVSLVNDGPVTIILDR